MLYSLSIFLYSAAIRFASLWNEKARAWTSGRKDWKSRLSAIKARSAGREVVWIHCASLGEFEQGRPVIEAIRNQYPNRFIVLSFFSPSGYEVRKNYEKADAVVYLPADTPSNAKAFVTILRPELTIFVKYEYWLNLLSELDKANIPVLLISSIFREGQVFFKWYGQAWRKALSSIQHFFLQDEQSAKLLKPLGILHFTIAGDTRFDRVVQIASPFKGLPEVQAFCDGSPTLVAGSTWNEDEELIARFIAERPALKCVIAPHEIHEAHLQQMEKTVQNTIRFSEWSKDPKGDKRVLIIDNIGMLSRLYHYGVITYIGGGFGKGIHNTLEAAVHAKPVIFGPRYGKFREAVELIECGGGFSIHDYASFSTVMDNLLNNDELCIQSGKSAGDYVKNSAGATAKIMNHIQEKRLLTS